MVALPDNRRTPPSCAVDVGANNYLYSLGFAFGCKTKLKTLRPQKDFRFLFFFLMLVSTSKILIVKKMSLIFSGCTKECFDQEKQECSEVMKGWLVSFVYVNTIIKKLLCKQDFSFCILTFIFIIFYFVCTEISFSCHLFQFFAPL